MSAALLAADKLRKRRRPITVVPVTPSIRTPTPQRTTTLPTAERVFYEFGVQESSTNQDPPPELSDYHAGR